ncbi:hypothetical protein MINS_12440 [Mycolicibacterium insubricum]|uniref:hypothetical protein n=1 Tax=Mycolicibacterium insubricum TaxID=444597 RepID=UPI00138C3D09|nr:hypothetical protein [Mycolicibacterium insubricum]MCV7080278.1 hypothetical protein [Mycolicibacterium insubricum]BBZ65815.1 hypothetical protein MINS_12440 [Mycolicibacterium insubricum]
MTLASSADVEARLGRDLTDVEQPRAAGLLDEASVAVTEWLGCTPEPVPDAVRIVVSRMVARIITAAAGQLTPDPGVSSLQSSMGPFQFTQGYSPDATSGGVWLSRQDKTMLAGHRCRGHAENVGTSRW